MILPHPLAIYTDGACSGNPGPGGWAYRIHSCNPSGETEVLCEDAGSELQTTNNRMELTAVIESLKSLHHPATVTLYTDSQYIQKGITQWIHTWKRNQWQTSAKDPVKNKDLWMNLENLALPHTIQWIWIKGHSGHSENDYVDQRARHELQKLKG